MLENVFFIFNSDCWHTLTTISALIFFISSPDVLTIWFSFPQLALVFTPLPPFFAQSLTDCIQPVRGPTTTNSLPQTMESKCNLLSPTNLRSLTSHFYFLCWDADTLLYFRNTHAKLRSWNHVRFLGYGIWFLVMQRPISLLCSKEILILGMRPSGPETKFGAKVGHTKPAERFKSHEKCTVSEISGHWQTLMSFETLRENE